LSKLGEIIKNACLVSNKSVSDEFNKKFGEMMTSISILRDEIKARDLIITDLKSQNRELLTTNDRLSQRVIELETESRRENLTFTGLHLTYAEAVSSARDTTAQASTNITDQVINICNNNLDVTLHPNDISAAYILAKGSASAPTVVMVKFVRREMRDKVFLARKKLKALAAVSNKKIFINDDLPTELRKLLGALRRLVKDKQLQGAWSSFGKIYAKKLDSTVISVKKISDVTNVLPHP
jgi:hypothetical protein